MKTTLTFIIAGLLLVASAFAPCHAVDLDKHVTFDIPAQKLSSAIIQFSHQAKVQVVAADALDGVNTNGIKGSHAIRDALNQLLMNTGLRADSINGKTVVLKRANSSTSNENPADQMRVAFAGDQDTDKTKSSGKEDKESEDATQVTVRDKKVKPDFAANADIPRTIDDAQPYYIFDAKTIERSGATDVEDFLKQRLTMNTTAATWGQDAFNNLGNTSSVNLRGLGTDKTLILINGRRVAGVTIVGGTQATEYQPDINGLPLSAIERIEVLPTSSSGIYGGSAIGGVINVVLKKHYVGGKAHLNYGNTFDTDAPTRRASASFGRSIENGKSQLMLTGYLSDAKSLLFGDRRELIDRGFRTILKNSPTFIYSATSPFLGAAPNITLSSSSSSARLVLDDGRSLGSRNTTVPLGTAPGISLAALSEALLGNAGKWNLDLPESVQSPTGLSRPLGVAPTTESVMATLNRHIGTRAEAFVELSYQSNHSDSARYPFPITFTIPASPQANPLANPFNANVRVSVPNGVIVPASTDSVTRSFTGGIKFRFPMDWFGELDFSRSENRFSSVSFDVDGTALTADVTSGALNLFSDTLFYPLNVQKYLAQRTRSSSAVLDDYALRASGPLFHLSWSMPILTVSLEHRIANTPEQSLESNWPITTTANTRYTFFARQQATDSGYAEVQVPVITKGAIPLLYGLDLQLAGRGERYTVDSGTPYFQVYQNRPDAQGGSEPFYGSPKLPNGQPFKAKASYTSNNLTMGLKYQPLETVTFRASLATAFLPPTYEQLLPDVWRSREGDYVSDPLNQDPDSAPPECVFIPSVNTLYCPVRIVSADAGNPNLKPQNSKSRNIGIIWEPRWEALKGFRVNIEYYKIDQFDKIGSLDFQTIVDNETAYPGRVSRDANNRIVSIDGSLLNLFKLETEGWDASFDYNRTTQFGVVALHIGGTRILHEQRQLTFTLPKFDYAGYVGDGGPAQNKVNTTLSLERNGWSATWAANIFGSYKQYGAAGSPSSIQFASGEVYGSYVAAQGSDTIPSQIYHDISIGYTFVNTSAPDGRQRSPGSSSSILGGVELQAGIRNIFNVAPPFDALYGGTGYYVSPYGDRRMRSYWVTLSKDF